MADNKAEQTLDAVTITLTGLTPTGANVFRGRVRDLQESELDALKIYRGENKPINIGDQNQAYLDMILEVWVEIIVKANDYLEENLALIENEVIVALKASTTQGLAYVSDTQEGGAEEPEIDVDSEKPTATMRLQFFIKYRRSRTDPSA